MSERSDWLKGHVAPFLFNTSLGEQRSIRLCAWTSKEVQKFSEEYTYLMIIRRKDGYFVLSEKGKKKLGGPYKKRKDAELRLRQVEYFKHIGR